MTNNQSKIEKLITELCPDGVVYKEMSKVLKPKENIHWDNSTGNKFQYIDLSSVNRATHKISDTTEINTCLLYTSRCV